MGGLKLSSRYDNPAMNAPEDFKNKILHASFHFGKLYIVCQRHDAKKN